MGGRYWVYASVGIVEHSLRPAELASSVRACVEYVRGKGVELGVGTNCGEPGVFVDGGYSSWRGVRLNERGGGGALLGSVREGDVIVCMDLGQLAVSVIDFAKLMTRELMVRGVSVEFVAPQVEVGEVKWDLMRAVLELWGSLPARLDWESRREQRALRLKGLIESRLVCSGVTGVHPTWNLHEALASPDARVFGYVCESVSGVVDGGQYEEVVDFYMESVCDGFVEGGVWTDSGGQSSRESFLRRPVGSQLGVNLRAGDLLVISDCVRAFRSVADMEEVLRLCRERGVFVWLTDVGLRSDVEDDAVSLRLFEAFREWDGLNRRKLVIDRHELSKVDSVFLMKPTSPKVPFWAEEVQHAGERLLRVLPERLEEMLFARDVHEEVGLQGTCDMLAERAAVRTGLPVIPREGIGINKMGWIVKRKGSRLSKRAYEKFRRERKRGSKLYRVWNRHNLRLVLDRVLPALPDVGEMVCGDYEADVRRGR